jgi:hypothetical protein
VLPLHHGVSRFEILDWRFWIKAQSAKSNPNVATRERAVIGRALAVSVRRSAK